MPLGCSVDHLHVHVAPLSFSLRSAFQGLYPESTWALVNDWSDLHSVHESRVPYVAIQEPCEQLRWAPAPADTRQPLRRAIASAAGESDQFDYSLHPHTDNVTRTVGLLTAM